MIPIGSSGYTLWRPRLRTVGSFKSLKLLYKFKKRRRLKCREQIMEESIPPRSLTPFAGKHGSRGSWQCLTTYTRMGLQRARTGLSRCIEKWMSYFSPNQWVHHQLLSWSPWGCTQIDRSIICFLRSKNILVCYSFISVICNNLEVGPLGHLGFLINQWFILLSRGLS